MRKFVWLMCAVMTMGLPALAQQAAGNAGAAQDQPPAHPITLDQVHEMLQLTGAMNLSKQMMQGMMPLLRQSMPPYIPEDVMEDIQNSLMAADLESAVVHAYQAHLSTEDGTAIIAFYKTAAGQRLLSAMPQIMKESQEAGGQLGQQIVEQVLEKHRAEIEAAKQKYEQEHGSSAPQK
jgi:hypothetical protein